MSRGLAEIEYGGRAGRRHNGRGRPARRSRWFRVRVETEGGTFDGRLQLDRARGGLEEVIDNGRAYLSLWDATVEGSNATADFLAIHKGAIRSVLLMGEEAAAPACSVEG